VAVASRTENNFIFYSTITITPSSAENQQDNHLKIEKSATVPVLKIRYQGLVDIIAPNE
jgi:hypothetical protein